jgi:hypothetical protein
MADAQYILTLRMTKNITKVINEKKKMMLETAAHFISIFYAPRALKSYMVVKAPSNVLSAISVADPDPGSGIGCLFDPWIPDLGSRIPNSYF